MKPSEFLIPEPDYAREARQRAELCPRTVCLYKPGVPLLGVPCHFTYIGRVPCTGPQVCMGCGRRKDEHA